MRLFVFFYFCRNNKYIEHIEMVLLGDPNSILYQYIESRFTPDDNITFICSPHVQESDIPKNERVIFFSSISIYSDINSICYEWQNNPFEEVNINDTDPYHSLELYIASSCEKFHIIRLGTLFGSEALYDPFDDASVKTDIALYTTLYYLDDLWRDIQQILKADIQVINLAGLKTRYDWLLPRLTDIQYIKNVVQINHSLKEYIALDSTVLSDSILTSNVSDPIFDKELQLINRMGIKRIQLDIGKYFNYNWSHTTMYDIIAFYKRIKLYCPNIEIYSVSNIFKNTKINVFTGAESYIQHLNRFICYAKIVNATYIDLSDTDDSLRVPIHNYVDANTAYSKSHAFLTIYLKAYLKANLKSKFCVYPVSTSNYLSAKDQVDAMVSVIDEQNLIAYSPNITEVQIAPTTNDIDTISKTLASTLLYHFEQS